MLSAQLSAMVNGGALGYAAINDLMAEADTELGAHAITRDGSAYRSYQQALKNALDRGNNNLNFVTARSRSRRSNHQGNTGSGNGGGAHLGPLLLKALR